MTATLRAALLRWYDGAARSLPWRGQSDPYAIWVSEIMLQQTRVDTVLRYYEPFLSRFPSAQALADASEDQVMSAWSGLGYYRRARLLHRGVREVVARYGGQVPRDAQQRRALPGVGRYTAGAIGSIAFDAPEPVVDGNVGRVFARLYGIETPLGRADTERSLWKHAEALVQGSRPGDLNQAVMELGATVCSKASPDCGACPLKRACLARRQGRQAQLPVPRARRAPLTVAMTGLLAASGRGAARRVFLVRGEQALFGALWNLPMAEGQGRPLARALLQQHGLGGRLASQPLARLTHVLSHRKLQLELWSATGARSLSSTSGDLRACTPAELSERGISRLTHRCLEALGHRH